MNSLVVKYRDVYATFEGVGGQYAEDKSDEEWLTEYTIDASGNIWKPEIFMLWESDSRGFRDYDNGLFCYASTPYAAWLEFCVAVDKRLAQPVTNS